MKLPLPSSYLGAVIWLICGLAAVVSYVYFHDVAGWNPLEGERGIIIWSFVAGGFYFGTKNDIKNLSKKLDDVMLKIGSLNLIKSEVRELKEWRSRHEEWTSKKNMEFAQVRLEHAVLEERVDNIEEAKRKAAGL